MESLSNNSTNTDEQIHHLHLILTQIKQCNNQIEGVQGESSHKNAESLEELVFALIPLMNELNRTFCKEINRTAETLQLTLHLLKRIQDTFQELGSVAEPISYISEISQILERTAKDLILAKKQLKLTALNKDVVREDRGSHQTDKFTSSDTEGLINKKEITCTAESPELAENLSEKKESLLNAQRDETDNTVISDTNDQCYKTDSEEESHQALEQMDKNNNRSLHEEQTYTADEHIVRHQELNDKTDHRQEYTGRKEEIMDTSSATELTLNGRTVNLSQEHLQNAEHWIYKEYTLKVEGEDEEQLACFIKAPSFVLQRLKCRFIDEISSLVVSDGEELVSSVLNISSQETDLKIPFPISISIPFNSHYRGSYKDVMVKTIDEKLQASYLTPISLDGYHGNHKVLVTRRTNKGISISRYFSSALPCSQNITLNYKLMGSFAEIKVYQLGTFSVISCLKKENFTVLRKGLSLKLSVDSRISLNYPPGCLSSAVIVQFKVQPIDTSLISLLKVKHDIFHPVVSNSPLVHVKQPSTQVFHKPVTVFLPCPPNLEKKKGGDESDKRASSAAASKDTGNHRIRAVSASVRKHGDNPSELLKLLALKEDQWIVLDDIVVKNVQNGIISFELSEHVQSFIVVRLSSAMDAPHLIQFIHKLEFAIHSSMVNVVLYKKKDNFHNIIVELVPSKELNWEISTLTEAGYTGPPEPSESIAIQEGDQIHFQFCGNISASDVTDSTKTYRLTFHAQKMQRKSLDLSVMDEFGNYSSPHYKGTVAFYRVSKEDIVTSYKTEQSTDSSLQQRTPVCKLPITLPKVEKNISRPSSTKLITCDPRDLLWDSVLKWVSHELTEEDATELLVFLPIRRSTIQLVKLKNPDNVAAQVYELLSLWKKRLPTSTDKFRLLARHLNKCGRSELVEQMKAKWESKMSITSNH